ncbi:MAG UNVERIFIED_CONTAM: hypothetical protein LVR18_11965 [Planctomycetaceae bacterium]
MPPSFQRPGGLFGWDGPCSPTIASNGLTGTLADRLSILSDLQTAGNHGAAATPNNEFTDAECRGLFAADEPDAVLLLLTGLERLRGELHSS